MCSSKPDIENSLTFSSREAPNSFKLIEKLVYNNAKMACISNLSCRNQNFSLRISEASFGEKRGKKKRHIITLRIYFHVLALVGCAHLNNPGDKTHSWGFCLLHMKGVLRGNTHNLPLNLIPALNLAPTTPEWDIFVWICYLKSSLLKDDLHSSEITTAQGWDRTAIRF